MIGHASPNRRLIETALGNAPADLVIRNGILMDVYTGRLVPQRSVAVVDRWVSYVGQNADHTIGEKTRVIDAEGRVICPGYMDTHTHLGSYWDIADFLAYAIPCGTTTYITEAESFGYVRGAEGFKAFLEQVRRRPVKFYCLIPPMVTISPALESLYITPDEARVLLEDEMVIGLGESYWQGIVLTPNNRILDLMQETLRAGKSVQGHAAGAFDRKLAAYAAAGALSCHESISPEDVLSRLELGYYVMVREGDIRRDLEILLPLRDKVDLRRVILVTDGTNPDLLVRQGYLVDVVQKAVDIGIDPIRAVQMVTLNPAEHFGIDHLTGGIAPNRFADILLLPDPRHMKPDLVLSEGRVVAEGGKVTVPLERIPYPGFLLETVKIDPLNPSELAVPENAADSSGAARIMEIQPGGLVAREGKAKPRIVNGCLEAAPEKDLLKVVFIERISGRGRKFIGFARGWGQRDGAAATTLCWEATGIVAVGSNDLDLASAINRVIEMQGGTTLSVGGRVCFEVPFRVGGFLSELSVEDIAARLARFNKELHGLGSVLEDPHLTLMVFTTSAIPFIRISESGYYRFRENDYVGL
ncbi:MAG: adenine deaminase [Deltaproteobacteria bacterium]|nr:adenine deaminase [Deltaproteobacteria bacterium]